MATVTTLGFNIRSSWDGSGTRGAQRSLIQLAATARAANASMSRSSAGMQALVLSAAAFAPALAPITQVAAGATVALTSMVATSGAALGVYGVAMAGAIRRTLEMAEAGDRLTPVQSRFVSSVNSMRNAWTQFIASTSPVTLRAATAVVQGLTGGLNKLAPVVNAMGPSVQRVANAFRNWATGSGMDRFVNVMITQGVPAFNALLNAGRNTLATLGIAMRTFAGTGVSVAEALERGSLAMRQWAEGGGFQRFLDRVRQNAPAVREFFRALVDALRQVMAAMRGLGPLALGLTTSLLRLVAAMPVGMIQALVVAWTAWRAVMLAHTLAMGLSTAAIVVQAAAIRAYRVALLAMVAAKRLAIAGMAAFRVAWLLLNTTFLATPLGWIVLAIGAIVAAIVLLATRTQFFQNLWAVSWAAIRAAFIIVTNVIRTAWQAVVNFIVVAWQVGSAALRAVWNAVWGALSAAARLVWDALRLYFTTWWTVVRTVFTTGINVIRTIWNAVWGALSTAAQTVWNALRAFFTAWWAGVRLVFTTGINAIRAIWTTVWNALRTVATTVFNAIRTAATTFWAVVRAAFTAGLNAIRTIWTTTFNGIRTAVTTFWSVVRAAFTAGLNAIRTAWTTVWNALRTIATTVFTAIRAAATAFWSAVRAAFTAGMNFIRQIWDAGWNFCRTLFDNVRNAIRVAMDAWWAIVRRIFENGLNFIRRIWDNAWNFCRTLFDNVRNAIRLAMDAWWTIVRRIFNNGLEFIKRIWDAAWNWCRVLFDNVRNAIRIAMDAWWAIVRRIFNNGLEFIKRIWDAAWNWCRVLFDNVRDAIRRAMDSFWEIARRIFNNGLEAIKRVWEDSWNAVRDTAERIWRNIGNVIEDAVNGVIGIINKLIDGFNNITDAVGIDVSIGKIPEARFNFAQGGVVNFAYGGISGLPQGFALGGTAKDLRHGGTISGYAPGRDTVPAVLSKGEGVLTPEAVRGLGGPGFVHSANREYAGHRGAGRGAMPLHKMHPQMHADGGMVQRFALGGITAGALARAGVSAGLISQGEYSTGVAASAGTHDGGGVIDLATTSPAILARLRAAGFAAWIRTPAQGFSPHIHAVLMNHPDLSPQARAQVVSFMSGGNGLGVGSIGGGIGSFFGDLLGDLGGLLRDIALGKGNPLSDIVGSLLGMFGRSAFETAFDWVGDLIGDFDNPAGKVGEIIIGFAKTLLDSLIDFLVSKDEESTPSIGGGAGGAGVAQWTGLAAKALEIAGLSAGQLGRFMSLMQAESGGNPNAINLTDINARRGQPSQGLMQVIPSTFRAFRDPSLSSNIRDPLANMVAAARYIKSRYGGIVPGSPYALGTHNATRGWHLVGERGPEMVNFGGGERVMNARETGELRRHGGHGVVFEKGAIQIDARGASAEAVREMEANLVPKLRMAVTAGVGKKGR